MKKVSAWKIPFLFIIGVLAWIVLFPDQFRLVTEKPDELIFQEQAALAERRANHFVDHLNDAIDICDFKFAEHGARKIIPVTGGCTEMACTKENPCCNSCSILWKIDGTELVVRFSKHSPANCRATNCGITECNQDGYLISALQKEACVPRLKSGIELVH